MADDTERDILVKGLVDKLGAVDIDKARKLSNNGLDADTEGALDAASPFFYALVQEPAYADDAKAVAAVMKAVDVFSGVDTKAYGNATGYTPGVVSAVITHAPYGSQMDEELSKKLPALLNKMNLDERHQFMADVIALGADKDAAANGSLSAAALRVATLPMTPKFYPGPKFTP